MIEFTKDNVTLYFHTHPSLFSPLQPDKGTLAMLETAPIDPEEKILDLGCGYGFVGIYLAKVMGCHRVVMTDIDPLAVKITKQNALLNQVEVQILASDGFAALEQRDFHLILSNPPYHTDFSVPKRFIEGAFSHLALQGHLLMVTKRRTWYENRIRAVFGGVRVTEKDGYFVFASQKRAQQLPQRKKETKTTKKHLKRMQRAQSKRD